MSFRFTVSLFEADRDAGSPDAADITAILRKSEREPVVLSLSDDGHESVRHLLELRIGGMTAPIARVTLDGAGEQGSSLLSLQLAEDIPDFVRSMSSAAADQIGKALLMDAKTDAGFLPSITLADYLPKGVTIDANPKAKA